MSTGATAATERSPSTFITPPFPGYVSGHSCVSGACSKALELFTGSDTFGATVQPGSIRPLN